MICNSERTTPCACYYLLSHNSVVSIAGNDKPISLISTPNKTHTHTSLALLLLAVIDLTFSSCHVLFVFVFVCLLFPFFCFYFLNCRFLKVRVWLRNGRAGSRRSSTAQREEDGLERASSTDLRESHDTHTHMHTSTHIHTSTHTHTFFSCQQSFAS